MKNIKTFDELNEAAKGDMSSFLADKPKRVKGGKLFLYHGTKVDPRKFELKDDWDGDNGNVYEADIPEGYLFLSNSFAESHFYGRYVIPCELRYSKRLTVKVDSDNPSKEFDDDFSGYGKYGMFTKFTNGDYDVLEIKGTGKSTFLTSIDNVVPRTDLAAEFYGLNNKKKA